VDGRDAVDVFTRHADSISHVILDLSMPNMDGMAAFTELVRIKPGLKSFFPAGTTSRTPAAIVGPGTGGIHPEALFPAEPAGRPCEGRNSRQMIGRDGTAISSTTFGIARTERPCLGRRERQERGIARSSSRCHLRFERPGTAPGLRVTTRPDAELCQLISLYPQPVQCQPSVGYIPHPTFR